MGLKLKICRGSSVKKILVREANAYSATHVMVGTAQGFHKIRSSTSVAKYCARKLSKDCCVLAVTNGKVVFKRDSSPSNVADVQGFLFYFGFFLVLNLIDVNIMNLVEFSVIEVVCLFVVLQGLIVIREMVCLVRFIGHSVRV